MDTQTKLHLAIIPDGNRRWAKQRLLKPWQGHEQAIQSFKEILLWACQHPQIGTLTIWGFSTENWDRSVVEVKHLMGFFEAWLISDRQVFHDHKTRLVHSGRVDRIPPSLATLLREIAAETKEYTDFTLNFALDYGGKDEIIRAIKKITNSQEVTAETLRLALDQPELPDIDIILRTSGEQRVSNFFMWQGAYAELFFIDTLFPDLTVADLEDILVQFKTRQRRFGS